MKPARAWAEVDHRVAVSLGRSQHALVPAAGLPVNRRLTGGGAVLRGPWLLRGAVRVPSAHHLVRHGPLQAARWLGGVHVQWLRRMGIHGAAVYMGPVVDHWCCWAGRVPGEAMLGDRKIAGIAQAWRRDHVLLASGVLLYPVPWAHLCEAMHRPASEAPAVEAAAVDAAQACREALRPPSVWADSLRGALAAELEEYQPRRDAAS